MKTFLTCLVFLIGIGIGGAVQDHYHSKEQLKAFKQGCIAGWYMRQERIVNNILHDSKLSPDSKRGWEHEPKPECYDEWKDVIATYDYGQNDK